MKTYRIKFVYDDDPAATVFQVFVLGKNALDAINKALQTVDGFIYEIKSVKREKDVYLSEI